MCVVTPQLYVFSIENKYEKRWKAIYSCRLTLFLFHIELNIERANKTVLCVMYIIYIKCHGVLVLFITHIYNMFGSQSLPSLALCVALLLAHSISLQLIRVVLSIVVNKTHNL